MVYHAKRPKTKLPENIFFFSKKKLGIYKENIGQELYESILTNSKRSSLLTKDIVSKCFLFSSPEQFVSSAVIGCKVIKLSSYHIIS